MGSSVDGAAATGLHSSCRGGGAGAGKRRRSSVLCLRAAGTKQQEERDDGRPSDASETEREGTKQAELGLSPETHLIWPKT